jgi:hypothetical protein
LIASSEAAAKDAKKLEELAAMLEQERKPRWYHGTDDISSGDMLVNGASVDKLKEKVEAQLVPKGLFVARDPDVAGDYAGLRSRDKKRPQPGVIVYWEDHELRPYLKGPHENDVYVPFECFDKIPRPRLHSGNPVYPEDRR